MMLPRVSIVIPIFNRGHVLESLFESLNKQTFKNFEVVFVDDASAEPIAASLHTFKADFQYTLVVNEQNRGVSFSRNAGINASRGEYLAFLDSDDLWSEAKLEKQLSKCLDCEGTVFSMTQSQVLRNGYVEYLPSHSPDITASGQDYILSNGGFAQVSSFLISKELASSIGFDNELSQYEDYLFFMHAFNQCDNFIYINEPLVIWDDRDSKDRLSGMKEFKRALIFYERIKMDFSKKHACFFINRFVAPYHFYDSPIFFLKNFYFSLRYYSSSITGVTWSCIKSILGSSIIGKIRRVYKS